MLERKARQKKAVPEKGRPEDEVWKVSEGRFPHGSYLPDSVQRVTPVA